MGRSASELGDDRIEVYLLCDSTSRALSEASLLSPLPDDPDQLSITYRVEDLPLVDGERGDLCTMVLYAPEPGPGAFRVFMRPGGPGPFDVPEEGPVSQGLIRDGETPLKFLIRYPVANVYRATYDRRLERLIVEGLDPPGWKIQVLVFEDTDFSYHDDAGEHRVIAHLQDRDAERIYAVLTEFFEDEIPALSSGLQRPKVTITTVPEPLTQLTVAFRPDCYWPSPTDVARHIDPTADTTVVVFEPRGTDEVTGQPVELMTCAALLSDLPDGEPTYTAVQANWWIHDPWFSNMLKFEWGYSILRYYGSVTAAPEPQVRLDRPGDYVNCLTGSPYILSEDPTVPNGLYHLEEGFTHDYLSGEIALATDPSRCLGIGADVWWHGGPTDQWLTPLRLFNRSFDWVQGWPPMPEGWRTEAYGRPEFSLDPSVTFGGDFAARIASPPPAGDPTEGWIDGRFVQTIEVEPETVYALSGWIRTEDVECAFPGGGATLSATREVFPVASLPVTGTTHEFVPVYVYFNSRDATTVDLQVRLGTFGNACRGFAWFDELLLERLDPYDP